MLDQHATPEANRHPRDASPSLSHKHRRASAARVVLIGRKVERGPAVASRPADRGLAVPPRAGLTSGTRRIGRIAPACGPAGSAASLSPAVPPDRPHRSRGRSRRIGRFDRRRCRAVPLDQRLAGARRAGRGGRGVAVRPGIAAPERGGGGGLGVGAGPRSALRPTNPRNLAGGHPSWLSVWGCKFWGRRRHLLRRRAAGHGGPKTAIRNSRRDFHAHPTLS